MTTEAGPPVVKELAEPMNRPEPMAPPLKRLVMFSQRKLHLHSDELHVSTLQITVQRILVAFHKNVSFIIGRSAELSTSNMVTEIAMLLLKRRLLDWGI